MCMDSIEIQKSRDPIEKRPTKTVIRWKRRAHHMRRSWMRARDWNTDDYIALHALATEAGRHGNHKPGSTGFHVYRYKKDAGLCPIRIECAHRLDVGLGDGCNLHIKVETYQWARRIDR